MAEPSSQLVSFKQGLLQPILLRGLVKTVVSDALLSWTSLRN